MEKSIKFDAKKLAKLNNPDRFKNMNPDLILEAVGLQNPDILIDIGSGTGFFATAFSKKLQNTKIYACDNSQLMIEWMQENITDKNIIPFKSLESKIDLPDECADLIYMINVHHELLEPEKILTEAYRLLKPKGKIAIIDWKIQETDQGPPLNIRVLDSIIKEQLLKVGFNNIKVDNLLFQFHSFLIGQK